MTPPDAPMGPQGRPIGAIFGTSGVPIMPAKLTSDTVADVAHDLTNVPFASDSVADVAHAASDAVGVVGDAASDGVVGDVVGVCIVGDAVGG